MHNGLKNPGAPRRNVKQITGNNILKEPAAGLTNHLNYIPDENFTDGYIGHENLGTLQTI